MPQKPHTADTAEYDISVALKTIEHTRHSSILFVEYAIAQTHLGYLETQSTTASYLDSQLNNAATSGLTSNLELIHNPYRSLTVHIEQTFSLLGVPRATVASRNCMKTPKHWGETFAVLRLLNTMIKNHHLYLRCLTGCWLPVIVVPDVRGP